MDVSKSDVPDTEYTLTPRSAAWFYERQRLRTSERSVP